MRVCCVFFSIFLVIGLVWFFLSCFFVQNTIEISRNRAHDEDSLVLGTTKKEPLFRAALAMDGTLPNSLRHTLASIIRSRLKWKINVGGHHGPRDV